MLRNPARTQSPETIVRHIRETRNEQEIENDLHTTDIDTELFLC